MNLDSQILLEQMYNRNQEKPLIRSELKDCPEIMQLIASTISAVREWASKDYFESKNKRISLIDFDILEDFYLDLAGSVAMFQRAKYTQVVGMVSGHIKTMPVKDAIRTTGELIAIAVESDLIDCLPATLSPTGSMELFSRITLEPKTLELINQYQYLPPLIVPPKKLTHNKSSAYYTIKSDSLILKNNHHDGDICLDSLNQFNSIAFSLNERVIRNIRDNRKHLDAPKGDESKDEYEARVNSFLKMEKESMHVFATLINSGNRFHFPHKTDKRGRTYCQGYHASYQGNCYRKAVIELADKEYLTEE